MAGARKMSLREMVNDMEPWEKKMLIAIVSLWFLVALVFWSCPVCYAASPQHFNKATWLLVSDPQYYLTAAVNGTSYGRVAPGTYYDYPTSYLVPDEIFKNSFQ